MMELLVIFFIKYPIKGNKLSNREKHFLIITDIFILILVTYPILQGGLIGGYDLGFHLGRIHTLATNIASGHFPNPIGFEYLNKFGYGIGFFYGNFFIYPFAILNILGVSTYNAYITYIVTFVILNIISINYVVSKLFHNSWATILSAPIYLSSYYIFGVIYFRTAAGELIAFAIIPWILLSTFKLLQGKNNYWIMLAISFSLLLVAHILSFLITAATVLLLLIFNLRIISKNKTILVSFLKSAVLAIGLSGAFLFSFVQQYLAQPYIDTSIDSKGRYTIMVIANMMHRDFDTKQFVAINGTFLTILMLLSLAFYLYKGKGFHFQNNLIPQAFLIIAIYGALLLSPNLLGFVVAHFKPLILLQVITRVDVVLLPLLTFVVANAMGQIIASLPKLKYLSTVGFFVLITVITVVFPIKTNLNFVAARKGPVSQVSTSMSEYEPKRFMEFNEHNGLKVDDNFLEQTENFKVTTNNHQQLKVAINSDSPAKTLMLPKIYYKGYRVILNQNGQKSVQKAFAKNGLVSVNLPKNFHGDLTVIYRTTFLAKLGWTLTFITLLLLVWMLLDDSVQVTIKQRFEKLITQIHLNSTDIVEK